MIDIRIHINFFSRNQPSVVQHVLKATVGSERQERVDRHVFLHFYLTVQLANANIRKNYEIIRAPLKK